MGKQEGIKNRERGCKKDDNSMAHGPTLTSDEFQQAMSFNAFQQVSTSDELQQGMSYNKG
jgi:hypothetical protein